MDAAVTTEETNPNFDRHCSNCKTTVTPLWRKFGPVKFLCNACGLYFKVNGDHRPYYMSKSKLNGTAKRAMLRCSNCGTNKTTMWRKNGNLHVCNACGLYFRINGHSRPVTMRKDVIRTRKRRDTTSFEMLNTLSAACSATALFPEQDNEYQMQHYSKIFDTACETQTSVVNNYEPENVQCSFHFCSPEGHQHIHLNCVHSNPEISGYSSQNQHLITKNEPETNVYYSAFV